MADEKHNLITWLGFTTEPDFSKARWLGHAIGYGFVTLYLCVFALLVGGLMWTITHVPDIIGDVIYAKDPSEARWLLASLAALTAVTSAAVALPFTVLKTVYNRRQTEVAEQSHITDQINKAVENLGATRPSGDRNEPNLEVRIGGLLALERIGRQNPEEHIQVMQILCSYIRENTNLFIKQSVDFAPDGRPNGDYVFPRSDLRMALDIIARRGPDLKEIEKLRPEPYRLDFHGTDFRGLSLRHQDFESAILSYAQFQGADLEGVNLRLAQLNNVEFESASLYTADLSGSDMSFCDFEHANLNNADLENAKIVLTDFIRSDLRDTSFRGSYINRVNFNGSRMQLSDFSGSYLNRVMFHGTNSIDTSLFIGAAICSSELALTTIENDQLRTMFGDGSVILAGKHATWENLPHWKRDHQLSQSLEPEEVGQEPIKSSEFHQAWYAWQDEIGFDRRTNRLKGHSD